VQDNEGYTPLHWACHCGNADIVEYLMSAGADVTIRNEEGLTPGQVAQRTGHVELVKLLEKMTFEKRLNCTNALCSILNVSNKIILKTLR
jgi:ankyrin repeat protein